MRAVVFVVYLQWTEYFSVYVGDVWLDALAMSRYQRTQVTAIHNNSETDREHAAARFREIDALARDFPHPERLLEAIEKAGRAVESVLERGLDRIASRRLKRQRASSDRSQHGRMARVHMRSSFDA